MGELLEPRSGVWCRQRWCRADAAGEVEHTDGDGCSCHGDAREPDGALAAVEAAVPILPTIEASATAAATDRRAGLREAAAAAGPRLTILKAKAARLAAFACRACGRNARRMIEAPEMFFRCEDCARADRWPPTRRQA